MPETKRTASIKNTFAYIGINSSMNYPLGDVDYSSSLNSSDATVILKYSSGQVDFSQLQLYLGDYNKDGVVNTGDAMEILKEVAMH